MQFQLILNHSTNIKILQHLQCYEDSHLVNVDGLLSSLMGGGAAGKMVIFHWFVS